MIREISREFEVSCREKPAKDLTWSHATVIVLVEFLREVRSTPAAANCGERGTSTESGVEVEAPGQLGAT